MIRASYKDKSLVLDILTRSFDDNKSVNYIVKQDGRRVQRIKKLMEYAFDTCYLYGDIFLSDNKEGCALVLLPDKKKITFQSILLDVQLAISCIGLFNIKKALDRETKIKKRYPKEPIYHIWFIGVHPKAQNTGIGGALLREVINEGRVRQRPVYLETSTLKNLPLYQKFGFEIYDQLDLGYTLFFLRKQ